MDYDWNNLRVILAISRGGSLTTAAEILNLDQTTAGRRLSALEDTLGVTLFRRAKSGFVPTEAGRAVIASAKSVESQLEGMAEKLVPDQTSNAGIVRILGNAWMLANLAEHALPALSAEHPDIEIRFASRLPPTPIYGEPTLALWFDAAPQSSDRSQAFARVPFAAYTHSSLSPERHDWVIFRDDKATGPSFARVVARQLGPKARIRMTGTDAAILAGAIKGGIGHGMLPTCVGDASDGLVRSDHLANPIERVLHLHTNPAFAGRARLQTVMNWLENHAFQALGAEPMG